MTCEGWKEAVWAELDGGSAAGLSEHLALCPSCRRYAETARRLHAALPSVLPSAAVPDFSQAVLGALRAERQSDAPAWALLGAAAVAAVGLYYGSTELGLDAAALDAALSDLQGQWSLLLGGWSFFAECSSSVSMTLSLPTLFAAGAAWFFSLRDDGRSPAQPAGGRS